MTRPIVIIGAGLSGLCCAKRLSEIGLPFKIIEASDGVGGRVRTDLIDGYRLDRGFQIYLPSYPEGRRVLDYEALNLKSFTRGAIVRFQNRFHRVVDPRESFGDALKSIFGPIGSVSDKWNLISFTNRMKQSLPELATDQPTIDLLRYAGPFSDSMIERLFRPFLGGVFLENDLSTSSRFFRFCYQQFATGPGAVPALGMQEIPNQIAERLPSDSIRLNTRVKEIQPGQVILESGEMIPSRATIVATEAAQARRLLGDGISESSTQGHGSITFYYATTQPPLNEPMLALNGDRDGLVNSVVNLTACSSDYSPSGQSLLSVSIVGNRELDDQQLELSVRNELKVWWGQSVDQWRYLKSYRIPYSLPAMPVGALDPWQRPVRIRPGVYVCGDHRDQGSINGAMESGFRAAQAVGEDYSSL